MLKVMALLSRVQQQDVISIAQSVLYRDIQPCALDNCPQLHAIVWIQCKILVENLYYVSSVVDWISVGGTCGPLHSSEVSRMPLEPILDNRWPITLCNVQLSHFVGYWKSMKQCNVVWSPLNDVFMISALVPDEHIPSITPKWMIWYIIGQTNFITHLASYDALHWRR